MFDQLRSVLDPRHHLSDANWQRVAACFTTQSIRKSDFLLQTGQYCPVIYFVEQGAFRLFYETDGDERNRQFFLEGSFMTDMQALRSRLISRATYLSMIEVGKLGGEKRTVTIQPLDALTHTASARVILETDKQRFRTVYLFVKTGDIWQIITDMPVLEPVENQRNVGDILSRAVTQRAINLLISSFSAFVPIRASNSLR